MLLHKIKARPLFRAFTTVPPEFFARISPSTGRHKRGRSGATINRKGIKPMLLQKRHEAAIEFEFVMGRPCPITTWFPLRNPKKPRVPPSQGLLFCLNESLDDLVLRILRTPIILPCLGTRHAVPTPAR